VCAVRCFVTPSVEWYSSVVVVDLQPSLVQACFNGDPDEVRAILYKKEDVNYQVDHLPGHLPGVATPGSEFP